MMKMKSLAALAVAAAVPVGLIQAQDTGDAQEGKVRVQVVKPKGDSTTDGRARVIFNNKELKNSGEQREYRVIVNGEQLKGTDQKKQYRVIVNGDELPGQEKRIRVLLDGDHTGHLTTKVGGTKEKVNFLGVSTASVSPELASQLGSFLRKEQGLVVNMVSDDSPAAKAGIKKFDVLATYDDQKLYSLDQLRKLVRGDETGREATLGVVRGGELKKIKVKIEQHEVAVWTDSPVFTPSHGNIFQWDGKKGMQLRGLPGGIRVLQGDVFKGLKGLKELKNLKGLESIEGLEGLIDLDIDVNAAGGKTSSVQIKMQSLDDDKFRMEVTHTVDGEKHSAEFEGTKEEIAKQIEEHDDLSESVRKNLMNSLKHSGKSGAHGAIRLKLGGGEDSGVLLNLDGENGLRFHIDGEQLNLNKLKDLIPEELAEKIRKQIQSALEGIEGGGGKVNIDDLEIETETEDGEESKDATEDKKEESKKDKKSELL